MLNSNPDQTIVDQKIYSVSELSLALKNHIEDKFALVTLKAEISGLKVHGSGHAYFTLKDCDAIIDGICWRGVLQKLPIKLEDGIEVICSGRITIYPARSKYQIVVDNLRLSGHGTLLKVLEDRKRKLAVEGLFDLDRKQLLPHLPRRIGIITSITGSVIRDILHRIADRFPVHIIIWPVAVQGDGAPEQIVQAIIGFNALAADHPLRPDVLIIARGGGSIEDLWCFNDENVVRATAASLLPTISAIGHETDTTLIDYAADHRAPTPTAAAERAVPLKSALIVTLKKLDQLFNAEFNRTILNRAQNLDYCGERLKNAYKNDVKQKALITDKFKVAHPRVLMNQKHQQFETLTRFLRNLFNQTFNAYRSNLDQTATMMNAYSHQKILQRGFCLVEDINGIVIQRQSQLTYDQTLIVKFRDGVQRVKTI